MEIHVDSSGAAPTLEAPDDFKGFKVVMHGDPPGRAAALEAVAAKVEKHAWITVDALRALAGSAATEAWEESLQGMVGYATSKGWFDEDLGAIRAHVERAPA